MEKVAKMFGYSIAITILLASSAVGGQGSQLPDGYAERLAMLEQDRQVNPSDLATLDALAGSYAMGGRYNDALGVVQQMIALEGKDSALILRLAKLYAWTDQIDRSLEQLQTLDLRRDPEAAEFKCQILSGAGRATAAASCYALAMKAETNDPARHERVLLGLARNLAWSGNSGSAVRPYERYLQLHPFDRPVTVELVRLLRYRGDYARAKMLCDQLLHQTPDDAEVLALRAEVLHWWGNRSREALRNAEKAASLAPVMAEARVAHIAALEDLGLNRAAAGELRELQDRGSILQAASNDERAVRDAGKYLESRLDELTGVRSELPYSVYNDADGVHNVLSEAHLIAPIYGDHTLRFTVGNAVASAPEGIFTAGRNRAAVREFSTAADVLVAPGLRLSLLGGGSTRSSEPSLRPFFNVNLIGSHWDRWRFEVGAARSYLKVTPRAIDRGIRSDTAMAKVRYEFDSRTSVSLEFNRKWWSDTNRSIGAEGVLAHTFRYSRAFHIDAGVLTGYELFNKDLQSVSGFFTPDRYTRHDGFLDFHGEVKRLMGWEVRGEGGMQQVTSFAQYNPNWAVTSSVSLKLGRSLRLFGSYERKNYTLLARDGWYQGFYISLGFRH